MIKTIVNVYLSGIIAFSSYIGCKEYSEGVTSTLQITKGLKNPKTIYKKNLDKYESALTKSGLLFSKFTVFPIIGIYFGLEELSLSLEKNNRE